jgi:7,8-dihydropterin-6-yl-methyl-4-(beta-D-ribofuranosyl)aminobenzene 5'-phosphate synthase
MKRRFFVKTLVIGTGAVVLRNYNVNAAEVDRNTILVKMIYNNTGINPGYKKEWGLAMWIEENNTAILFDTGGNPDTLWKNIQAAGIDLSKLSVIIISHNHWDHTRGIPFVLEKTPGKSTIFVPASDAPEIKDTSNVVSVIPVTDSRHITGSIWTTGEMKGFLGANIIYEQSVIILRNSLVYLFTGCAHPGIISIVEKTESLYPDNDIDLVAGGFHLIDKTDDQIQEISAKLSELNVKKIAPSHCTGDKAINFFKTAWNERFVNLNIGDDFKT